MPNPKGASGRSYKGTGGVTRTPHKKKGRKESSRRWIERQLNDPFVAEAKAKGYRARSALKLEQIDSKYRIFKANMSVLDLGCAPGGWLQYVKERVGKRGILVGVDLLETEALAGTQILRGDMKDSAMLDEIKSALGGKADVVLSDMAADTIGHQATDHLRTTALLEIAFETAKEVLIPGGIFLGKCFRGGAEKELLAELQNDFDKVRHVKPSASRSESPEIYVLAMGYNKGYIDKK